MTPDVPLPPADVLRSALSEALKMESRAKKAFAAPYSGFDAARTYFEAQGYCRGLARALEALDGPGAG